MNILKIFIVMLLSGQIAAAQMTVTPDQGMDGWRKDSNGQLDYIIKLTPETAQKLQNGMEATFEIPAYVLAYMSKVTVQVGTQGVERNPTIDELKAEFEKLQTNDSLQLSMLNEPANALKDKMAQIDRTNASSSTIQNVSQNTTATPNAGSSMTVPPSNFSATGSGSSFSNNPAISGNTRPSQNPALAGSPTATNNSNVNSQLFPVPSTSTTYPSTTSSSIRYDDPPSMSPTSGYSMTSSPAYPSAPVAQNPGYAVGTRGNEGRPLTGDGFNSLNSNFGANTLGSGYGNYSGLGTQLPNQYNQPTPLMNSQFTSTGMNNSSGGYLPSQAGTGNAGTANYNNPGYNSSDFGNAALNNPRFASNTNQAVTGATTAASNLEADRIKEYYNQELQRAKANFEQSVVQDYNRKLVEVEAKSKNELFLFRILSLILFVACAYLVFWMMRITQSYRALQANSRSSFNLSL